jgi:hypothetical protein
VPRERAVGAAGNGENGKACGCASAASIVAGLRLDLAETVPFAQGSGEARSPIEAPVDSTHRPSRPGHASPPAAAFE